MSGIDTASNMMVSACTTSNDSLVDSNTDVLPLGKFNLQYIVLWKFQGGNFWDLMQAIHNKIIVVEGSATRAFKIKGPCMVANEYVKPFCLKTFICVDVMMMLMKQ